MLKFDIVTGDTEFHDPCLCSFGIIESIIGIVSAITAGIGGGVATGLGALGVGEATAAGIGSIAGPAIFGAGTGALTSAVTGGDPLTGALTGGLTGGLGSAFGGAGGALSGMLGSETAANGLIGAASGALGSGLTGKDPLMGALYGGAGGVAMGASGALNGAAGGPGGGGGIEGFTAGQTGGVGADTAGGIAGGGGGVEGYTAGSAGSPTTSLNPQSTLAAKGGDSSGALSGLLSGKNPALLLGALSAASSMFNKPQQGTYALPGPSSNAANLGPSFNTPLMTTAPGRTAVTPYVPNYYTYGQIPGGATYFQGNSLRNYGFARGGALNGAANENGEFMTDSDNTNHVRGPGGPTDDRVPALLSNGEYVLTAKETSGVGNGSNEKGARKLDRLRKTGALSQVLQRTAA